MTDAEKLKMVKAMTGETDDYMVKRVAKSLNSISYAVSKVTVS